MYCSELLAISRVLGERIKIIKTNVFEPEGRRAHNKCETYNI